MSLSITGGPPPPEPSETYWQKKIKVVFNTSLILFFAALALFLIFEVTLWIWPQSDLVKNLWSTAYQRYGLPVFALALLLTVSTLICSEEFLNRLKAYTKDGDWYRVDETEKQIKKLWRIIKYSPLVLLLIVVIGFLATQVNKAIIATPSGLGEVTKKVETPAPAVNQDPAREAPQQEAAKAAPAQTTQPASQDQAKPAQQKATEAAPPTKPVSQERVEPTEEKTSWSDIIGKTLRWLILLIATAIAVYQVFKAKWKDILAKPGFVAGGVVFGLNLLVIACFPGFWWAVVSEYPGKFFMICLAAFSITHFLNHKSWVGKLTGFGLGIIVLVNFTDGGITWWGTSESGSSRFSRSSRFYSGNRKVMGKYTSRGIDFSNVPRDVVLKEIATCESGNSHFNEDGSVKHNQTDREDSWGQWQINMKDPAVRALMEKNGLDPKKEADNQRAAELIYETEGLKPWIGDKACWEIALQRQGYGTGSGQLTGPIELARIEAKPEWSQRVDNPRRNSSRLSWSRLDTSLGGNCEVRFDGNEDKVFSIKDSLSIVPSFMQFRCPEEGATIKVELVPK